MCAVHAGISSKLLAFRCPASTCACPHHTKIWGTRTGTSREFHLRVKNDRTPVQGAQGRNGASGEFREKKSQSLTLKIDLLEFFLVEFQNSIFGTLPGSGLFFESRESQDPLPMERSAVWCGSGWLPAILSLLLTPGRNW